VSYDETQELQRRLDNAKRLGLKALEIEQRKQSEAADQKRAQEAARKAANEETDRRELATLKATAARAWPGSPDSFQKFWDNGGADRVRADELSRRMQSGQPPIADLN
jgi:hypothetical protein